MHIKTPKPLLAFLFFFPHFWISAQSMADNPSSLFNNFSDYLDKKRDVDSAYYCIQKLAENKKASSLVSPLIHEVFAQNFIPRADRAADTISRRIYGKMLIRLANDPNPIIAKTVQPLFLWVTIRNLPHSSSDISKLVNAFLNGQLQGSDLLKDRVGRYGLLIYQSLSNSGDTKYLAQKIFSPIHNYLREHQIPISDTATIQTFHPRAAYRYLYAFTNYTLSHQAQSVGERRNYLKIAFDFSPDRTDRQYQSSYFYDEVFLNEEKEAPSFKDEYLKLLESNKEDHEELVAALRTSALAQPEFKPRLEAAYNQSDVLKKPFAEFWLESVNKSGIEAKSFSLPLLNNVVFSSKKALAKKWMLIDFWGTWCAPCREEHPELQKFSDLIKTNYRDQIELLTVACHDQESKVISYLKENRYTFPVAMSNKNIETDFKVSGYPTKILISPEGRYTRIPFNSDWVEFVKAYANLR